MNFWNKLNKPFFALAPMEDVTDTVFRQIVLSISDPNILKVVFTEFMSTDGFLNEKGRFNVAERIRVDDTERALLKKTGTKLVVQIWGNAPEYFYETARQISAMALFDGIDINMGCPVKKVVKKNTCSALIKNPNLAAEIIQATKEGSSIPVSVKTRIGFNKVETERWGEYLLKQNIAALTFHGRTQKMMSNGHANWDEIKKAVEIRNGLNIETKVLGNGDVVSFADGQKKIKNTSVDGIMVGRGIFSNPFIFNAKNDAEILAVGRLKLMLNHIDLFNTTWGGQKSELGLRRFFKIYIQDFSGAAQLRKRVMQASGLNSIKKMVSEMILEIES